MGKVLAAPLRRAKDRAVIARTESIGAVTSMNAHSLLTFLGPDG